MFSVAVVGHSNLPSFSCWDGVHVELFKKRGASLSDLVERVGFKGDLFVKHWDCVVLFLGGNDLNANSDRDDVFNLFLEACNSLHYDKLLLTDIEPRTYSPEKALRYNVTTQQYDNLRSVVNKKLKRFAKREKKRFS